MQFSLNPENFELDIVGFLAILGEGSLQPIAQVATLSPLVYLPRLLPAPQVFIKPSRPEKLETVPSVKVVGPLSGNYADELHHVAHAIHRGDKLPANSVKLVSITEDPSRPRPSVRTLSALNALAVVGFLMSVAIFALSVRYKDGLSMLATIFLSFLGTLTGWSNRWQPTPNNPQPDPKCPRGNVVIKYPQGAFVVVECDELISRYLYFNPSEKCLYTIASNSLYRLLSLVGTLLLMGGVICLANAKIELQSCFATAYGILNILYWVVAALPPEKHWDLSRLKVREIEVQGGFSDPDRANDTKPTSYTEALWKAIAITGHADWVEKAHMGPHTPAWKEWYDQASDAALLQEIEKTVSPDPANSHHEKETWLIPSWNPKQALSDALSQSRMEAG